MKQSIRRGQASLELLFGFLIVLAMIGSLFFMLLDFYEKTERQKQTIEETVAAGAIARTLDALAGSGAYKITWVTNRSYKIDNALVILESGGKTIVANTIFNMREGHAQQI